MNAKAQAGGTDIEEGVVVINKTAPMLLNCKRRALVSRHSKNDMS